jgi:hypothetical protein
MRTAPLLIALFILVGAAALSYLPSVHAAAGSAGSGPGAYPLGPRPQYGAKIRMGPFQPAKNTGSDEVPPSSFVDAKAKCLTDCPAIRA